MADEGEERAGVRQDQILDAALRVFLKFGYARVAMADIATEAGLSRAALYHYHAGKEALVRALMERIHAGTLEAARRAATGNGTFEARLIAAFDARLGEMWRLLRESPHRDELTDASHRVTGEATRAADATFQSLIEQVFETAEAAGEIDPSRADLTAANAADLCVLAAKGLMQEAAQRDGAAFETRLRALVRLTALALTPPA